MKRQIMKPRRFGRHLIPVLDHLADLGATDVSVAVSGHLHVRWRHDGRPFRLVMAGSPRDRDISARQTIKTIDRLICRSLSSP